MLILSENDIIRAIDFRELLESAEKALLVQESGDFTMPDRVHCEYGGNVLLAMPAAAGDYASAKLVAVHPENAKLGMPLVQGTVTLLDGRTGEPLALLNGTRLTALRTGAVGALGLAYTTPKGLHSLGIIGAGEQGYHQAIMACAVRNIRELRVHDRDETVVERFMERMTTQMPDIRIIHEKDARQLVSRSEAIITATTSHVPVIPDDEGLVRDRHFIGIGSFRPGMREFPDALFRQLTRIFVDTPLAAKESGDVAHPLNEGFVAKEQVITLGKVINGESEAADAGTTLFKSVGMALFDLFAAVTVYRNALALKIGINAEL